MVKVFTTGLGPEKADEELNEKFHTWITQMDNKIEIISVHSNSNRYGWMLVVHYRIRFAPMKEPTY